MQEPHIVSKNTYLIQPKLPNYLIYGMERMIGLGQDTERTRI